jgi:hypothetical protein
MNDDSIRRETSPARVVGPARTEDPECPAAFWR